MAMRKPKIGLLALYLKLYDDTQAWLRDEVEGFKTEIENKLEETLTVVHHPVCRLKEEIEAAVCHFEKEEVDALVTLHLAYSPSLECYEVLAQTSLPILVLDTTPDYSFNAFTGAGRIMQNHGIHGVQDMCSMLRRSGVKYQVFAGHYQHSNVLQCLHNAAAGAMMAHRMHGCRVGRVGESFAGMGDFLVGDDALQKMDITVVPFDFEKGAGQLAAIPEEEIQKEWQADSARFTVKDLSQQAYTTSARVGMALRKWIEEEKLDAITVNFLETENNPALPVMPFLELCKSMERGIGYAGEGDAMNAAFVAALMAGFPKTTFAEMFCPDWKDNSVFLSHMGEFNPAVAAQPILLTEMDFSYTSAGNPATLYACFEGEENAGFVNLNPIENGRYLLIAAPGRVLPIPEESPEMQRTVRGWFAPQVPVPDFLRQYSLLGGGHHGAVVYNWNIDTMRSFAGCMGWDFAVIE